MRGCGCLIGLVLAFFGAGGLLVRGSDPSLGYIMMGIFLLLLGVAIMWVSLVGGKRRQA